MVRLVRSVSQLMGEELSRDSFESRPWLRRVLGGAFQSPWYLITGREEDRVAEIL